jgi:hypothetical protein
LLLLHWQRYPSLLFLRLHRLALIYFNIQHDFTMIPQHIKVYYMEVSLSLPVWMYFITTLSLSLSFEVCSLWNLMWNSIKTFFSRTRRRAAHLYIVQRRNNGPLQTTFPSQL